MRKIDFSGKFFSRIAFNSRAEFRSRPNGFSTTTRASNAHSDFDRPSTTVSKNDGGIAR